MKILISSRNEWQPSSYYCDKEHYFEIRSKKRLFNIFFNAKIIDVYWPLVENGELRTAWVLQTIAIYRLLK